MNSILTLVKKDFRLFFKDRGAFAITFIVPFALIYLFGQVFGVNQKNPGPSGIKLAIVNESSEPGAKSLVEALSKETAFWLVTESKDAAGIPHPLVEQGLPDFMRANDIRFALVLPADLISPDRFGLSMKVYSNPYNDIETQTVNGLLMRDIFVNAPKLLRETVVDSVKRRMGPGTYDQFNDKIAEAVASTFHVSKQRALEHIQDGTFGVSHAAGENDGDADSSKSANDFLNKLVHVDTVQIAGKDVKTPAATRLVGGWAIQFLLFALTFSATSLFREKDKGLFLRLLSAPVTRSQILWSKFIYGILMGLVQLLTLFVAGWFFFKIDILDYIVPLAVVCVFAAAACCSFGMLIAAVAGSPETARAISTFVILVMSCIGGAWFPVSYMPATIQSLSRLTLVYWSVNGFEQVLWEHTGFGALAPTLGILAGMTALVMAISVWRFRKGRVFD